MKLRRYLLPIGMGLAVWAAVLLTVQLVYAYLNRGGAEGTGFEALANFLGVTFVAFLAGGLLAILTAWRAPIRRRPAILALGLGVVGLNLALVWLGGRFGWW